jgi:biopolymer transport protein ExbD
MKIKFILISILINLSAFGQSQINIPTFPKVSLDYDLKDYVTISIDKSGQIYSANEKIALEELRSNLFKSLKYKAQHEGLRLPISIVEIIADKDLKHQHLDLVIQELRKMSFLKVHFVANSPNRKRIEGFCTTGILYSLNGLENSTSIISEVRDSLNSEQNRYVKENNIKVTESDERPFPPPPPPPKRITSKQLLNGDINIKVKQIEISDIDFKIDGKNFSKGELAIKIKEWVQTEETAFILEPHSDANCQNVFYPIFILKESLTEIRKKNSVEIFNKEFEKLNYSERRKIKNMNPFILVFNE